MFYKKYRFNSRAEIKWVSGRERNTQRRSYQEII